jgi:G patch domain-containing protein 1
MVSTLAVKLTIRFSPPNVPDDWIPSPTLGAPISSIPPVLAPKDRGALLDEKPLPGKSVFSFLTPEARARISQATGRSDLPPALNELGSSSSRSTTSMKSSLPSIGKETALAALRGGFLPYGDDPEKQKRYRAYLEIQAEVSERPLTHVLSQLKFTNM